MSETANATPALRLSSSLTGIRGVAALLVCASHAAFWTGHYTDDLPGRILARLEIGVPIFFTLSGFLLFHPWISGLAQATGSPSLRRYADHRVRRILPAYWVTVLVVYAVYAWFRTDDSEFGRGVGGLVRNLTLTQIYGFGHLHTALTQMWSLAVEVVFYLALPAIGWVITAIVCRRRWRPDLVLVSLVALLTISPLWALATHSGSGIDPTARLWPPAFLSWFVGGMILAVAVQVSVRANPTLLVLIAVLLFQLSCAGFAGEPTITPTTMSATVIKLMLYLGAAMCLVGALVLGPPGSWIDRLLSRPMIVWLGEISYEFFLTHLLVLEIVMDILDYRTFTGSTVGVFVVTTVITAPIAWALHRVTSVIWRRPSGRERLRSVPSTV
ncbi:MAG: acyltransferase [Corynebacteriales bacterium]|nr:acyltransferase [Mycobacteriales bacterium]